MEMMSGANIVVVVEKNKKPGVLRFVSRNAPLNKGDFALMGSSVDIDNEFVNK